MSCSLAGSEAIRGILRPSGGQRWLRRHRDCQTGRQREYERSCHTMKILELGQATASLAEYARAAKSEPVILTEQGNPVAAILAIEDVDVEALSLGSNPQFLAIIERARARLAAEGGIPSEEMRRRLGLDKRRG